MADSPCALEQVDFATYATLNGSTAGGSGWYSQLNPAVPPTALRDTTARPMLPPSTSSSLPTASATASASSKPSGGLQVGLSVGLSGLFVVLAVVATWYFFRRRQRSVRRSEKSSLHSLSWTPDMHSLRSSTVASASSTSHDAATLNAKAASGRVLRSAERDGAQTPGKLGDSVECPSALPESLTVPSSRSHRPFSRTLRRPLRCLRGVRDRHLWFKCDSSATATRLRHAPDGDRHARLVPIRRRPTSLNITKRSGGAADRHRANRPERAARAS